MSITKVKNPLIPLDYPDPDVIRVGDTYYLISTTMHFFPGCEILKSNDLVHWEHASYVYSRLDSTDAQQLKGNKNIYGKGMWAASLRYHEGLFFVLFVANDIQKTYLYSTDDLTTEWSKQFIEGFYHDASLLFDDDGRNYIVYGNTDIWLTELNSELTGPKKNGVNRLIISERNPILGHEGAHFYKINGRYYIFLIRSLPDRWMRVQSCFTSDSIEGEFSGEDILCDDRGVTGQGVAQGGIVDTPEGAWYMILFQDLGAVGRLPILVPFTWKNNLPVIGEDKKIPESIFVQINEEQENFPLVGSDDFKGFSKNFYGLKPFWQFNHEPDENSFNVDIDQGHYELTNQYLVGTLTQARNTLTQRMLFPKSSVEVTIDFEGLKNGDVAGLCALQGGYGFIAVTKREGNYYLIMKSVNPIKDPLKADDYLLEKQWEERLLHQTVVQLKAEASFEDGVDEVTFYYKAKGKYEQIGITHKLFFRLDHFTGCRYGLFSYATEDTGGKSRFSQFKYTR